MKELFIESIIDPKTGTQVLVRKNDFEPYYINAGELVKARKDLKKKKLQSKLDSLSYIDSFYLLLFVLNGIHYYSKI